MAFPIVPQAPCIVFEIRAFNGRALERRGHVAAVKTGGVIDKGEHVLGHTQVFHDGSAHAAYRRQRHQAFFDTFGNKTQQRRIDKQIHLGRMRGLAEDVQHIAHAVTHRVHQVVALLRNAGFVADVVK